MCPHKPLQSFAPYPSMLLFLLSLLCAHAARSSLYCVCSLMCWSYRRLRRSSNFCEDRPSQKKALHMRCCKQAGTKDSFPMRCSASARGTAHLSASARSFRSCCFWFAMLSCCTKRWVSSNSACLAACRAWLQVAGVTCYTGKETAKEGGKGMRAVLSGSSGLAEVRVKAKPTKKRQGLKGESIVAFNLRPEAPEMLSLDSHFGSPGMSSLPRTEHCRAVLCWLWLR